MGAEDDKQQVVQPMSQPAGVDYSYGNTYGGYGGYGQQAGMYGQGYGQPYAQGYGQYGQVYGAPYDPNYTGNYGGAYPPPYDPNYGQQHSYGGYDQKAYTPNQYSEQPYKGNPNDISFDVFNADTDTASRHAFIRKVFVILAVCLAFSFGFAAIVSLVVDVRLFLIKNVLAFSIVGILLYIVPVLALICSSTLAQKVPINFILLALMTIGVACILGTAAASTYPTTFFIALGITMAVTVGLILFAMQTKFDFTGWGPYLMVLGIALLLMIIISIFVSNPIFHTILASFGAFLMGCYLVFDTQLIVGGKHRKYQLSIDQYITAVVMLFMDIVTMFLYILELVRSCTE